ncbi:MAG: type II CAAX endopeptidase family protein [Candidatus Poribacteria bacterium]|nr:type II CAAX endopeptidase family protein [Candidatus Poribacteria bacterium]
MSNEPVYPSVKQGVLLVLVVIALLYSVSYGLSALVANVGIPFDAAFTVAYILSFGGVFVYGFKRAKAPIRSILPLTSVAKHIYLPIAATAVGMVILFLQCDRFYAFILERLLPSLTFSQSGIMEGASFYDVLSFVIMFIVVAPITEEPLFRGLLLRGFLAHRSRWSAILISSLLFGAAHMNLRQFLPAVVIGGVFAWWRIETGSVLPALIGHFLYNLAAVLSQFLYGAGTASGVFQPIWLNAIGALLLLAGVFGLRTQFQNLPKDADRGGIYPRKNRPD